MGKYGRRIKKAESVGKSSFLCVLLIFMLGHTTVFAGVWQIPVGTTVFLAGIHSDGSAVVSSASMEDTIPVGSEIIFDKTAYQTESPERGDIIVYRVPGDDSTLFVKRIVGLPGERLEIKEGSVYINDGPEPLYEPYVKEPPVGSFGPYEIPKDSYFVMGDNRNNSLDSRYSASIYVPKENLVGKVKEIKTE